MEKEIIYGQIIAKANSYMVADSGGFKHIIKNNRIRAYERTFYEQCKIYKDKMIEGRFRLVIDVFHSSIRFDLDNSLKTVLDCLQQCRAVKDDNQCFSISAAKHIDSRRPRIEFYIEQINEQIKIF